MELRPLASLDLTLAGDRLFMLGNTPVGSRMIGELSGAELTGDRIKASLKGLAAADWTAGPATAPIYAVVELETADDRYRWFAPDFTGVSYEFFELA